MKLWITGANGFLGRAIQNACKRKKISYVATTKQDVDISSFEQIERFSQIAPFTHIVNCAALAHVDLSEKDPEKAFNVNALGPENLGKLAQKVQIPILHFSTEYIFNGCSEKTTFEETDIPHPIGAYATTKWEGEQRLLAACPHACIIRTSWLFGGEGKTFLSSLFERMQKEKILKIASDQKNRATFIEDLAEAVFSLLHHHGVFHFANQGIVSRYDIGMAMRECAFQHAIHLACKEIIPLDSSAFMQLNQRPKQCILNTDKIEKIISIRSWQEAVKDLVKYATHS